MPQGDTLAVATRLRATYSNIDWSQLSHSRGGAAAARQESLMADNIFRRKFRVTRRS